MARRHADTYITTPECVAALHVWLQVHAPDVLAGLMIEPFAGIGLIPAMFSGAWIGSELQAALIPLAAQHMQVVCANAFAVAWPAGAAMISNPPFSQLPSAILMASDHAVRGDWAWLLARTPWFSEPSRRTHRDRGPTHELRMSWRPAFTGSGSADQGTYSWFGWAGRWRSRSEPVLSYWVERPVVEDRWTAVHAAANVMLDRMNNKG